MRADAVRLHDISVRTRLLATIAGWALVVWLLALFGMGGQVHRLADDTSLLQPLPVLRPSPPERLGPLAQYSEIAARPLFSEDRRPKPFSLQPEGEGEPANTFDFILTSVLITPGLQMAILQPSAGGESIRIKLGDAPEAAAAWRLTDLHPRSAVFSGPEGEKSLDLRVYDGNGGEQPTQVVDNPTIDTGAVNAADAAQPAPANVPMPPPPKPTTPQPSKPVTATATATPDAPPSQDAQVEAIRKRIEARRAQLKQQPPPDKNP